MTDLDNGLRIAAHAYAPRFMGFLGNDSDGRSYYALSPGLLECKAAQELIALRASDKQQKSNSKKLGSFVLGVEKRDALTHWPWFVAVWGKKPYVQPFFKKAKNDDMDTDEDGTSKWWGFSKPEEIRKLATWIAEDSDLNTPEPSGEHKQTPLFTFADKLRGISPLTDASSDMEDDIFAPHVTRDMLKTLVKGLNDYAENLDWRVGRGEDVRNINNASAGQKSGNGSSVNSAKFYS